MDDVLAVPAGPPPVALSCGPLGAVQAAEREIGRQTAVRARAVAEFAASRPVSVDRPQGSPGAMSGERWAARGEVLRAVSEWATQELVVALSVSAVAAEALLERSLTLVHRLPGTLTALEAGALHAGHLGPMLDHVAPIADDALRAAVERDLLAWAAGRLTTPAQLRDKARREVLKRAARSAADRLVRAVRERGVGARPDRVDGMSMVSALLTTPEAAALVKALGAYADALPDDGRPRGQKTADCLLDLVLRPGESGPAPVQVTLDVIAPLGALLGGDQPCEIDGQVVPAEVVRALLAALTGQPLVTTTRTEPTGAAQDDTAQDDTLATDTASPASPVLTEEDFALWSAQLEDRILAGEFDAEPPPDAPDEDAPPPDGLPADVPPAPPPSPARTPTGAAAPDGWWARADRAGRPAPPGGSPPPLTRSPPWPPPPTRPATPSPPCSAPPPAADWPTGPSSCSPTPSPAPCSSSPTCPPCTAPPPAEQRSPHPARPAATGPAPPSTATSAPATAAAASPAAAAESPRPASSTTTPPGPPVRPPRPTSPATAPATIAASTRHPAGTTT